MDRDNLRMIFQRYIDRFDELNRIPEPDESFKWRVVYDYQQVFDIDAEDFPAMLKAACKISGNLVDGYTQPFSGLVCMAERDGEAEQIRELFRALYDERDGYSPDVIQPRIERFLDGCNRLIEKHYPGSFRYRNDQRSAMAYLWLIDPEHYYLVKNTECKEFAKYAEFFDDWGTYDDFKMGIFCRFCDELIEEMKATPELMAIHRSRFIGHENKMAEDHALHILLFDVIYCSYTYDLWAGLPLRTLSAHEKKKRLENRKAAQDRLERLNAVEEELAQYHDAIAAFAELSKNGELIHRQYGKGQLIDDGTSTWTIRFPEHPIEKSFDVGMLFANGVMTIQDAEFSALLDRYRSVLKKGLAGIQPRLATARKLFEEVADQLD